MGWCPDRTETIEFNRERDTRLATQGLGVNTPSQGGRELETAGYLRESDFGQVQAWSEHRRNLLLVARLYLRQQKVAKSLSTVRSLVPRKMFR